MISVWESIHAGAEHGAAYSMHDYIKLHVKYGDLTFDYYRISLVVQDKVRGMLGE